MAKQVKLSLNGVQVYPQTITDAIADITEGKKQSTINAELREEISGLKTTAGGKVASVTKGSNGIQIGGTATTPTVGLKLDNSGNVQFSESTSGLKGTVSIPDAPVKGVASGEKVLSLDSTTKLLSTTLSLSYDSSNQLLKLLGKDSVVISSFSTTAFTKDKFVQDAKLYTDSDRETDAELGGVSAPNWPYIKLTFNDNTAPVRFSVKNLVDVYDASTIKLTSSYSTTYTESDKTATIQANTPVQTAIRKALAITGSLGTAAFVDTTTLASSAQGGKADSALQEVTQGTDGDYISLTIGTKTADKKQSIGASLTVQPMSSAGTSAKGLAEASDVKTYITNNTVASFGGQKGAITVSQGSGNGSIDFRLNGKQLNGSVVGWDTVAIAETVGDTDYQDITSILESSTTTPTP